jgi:uncharacterized RDD family membrane protein YckC
VSRSWVRVVVISAVAWGLAAAAARADRLFVAGNEQALWLLHSREGGRFDLVVRPAGGTWQWVAADLSGTAAAMTAERSALHVAFTSRQYLIFHPDSPAGSPGLSLPAVPMAMCSGADLGPQAGSPVALVPAAAATRPATASAPSGRDSGLDVLAYNDGQWQHLATAADLAGDLEQVRVTAWRGALVLWAPPAAGRGGRMMSWKDGEWHDVKVPAEMAQGRLMTLTSVEGRLTAVVAQPTTQPGMVHLEVAASDAPGQAFVFQPVTANGEEVSWSTGDSPAAGVLADKLAVVWGPAQAPKLATFSPATGRLDPIEDVKIFQQPQADERAEQIREIFLWGVLALVLVPLFVLRPGGAPKPFSLPEPLRPAPLARRLAAGVVDLLPFHLAAGVYLHFALPMSAQDAAQLMMKLLRGRGPVPVEVAYAWAGTALLYLVYCVLTEMRFAATVGKALFKLRVVGDEGAPPRKLEILLRNLFKIVEVFYFFPLLLAVVITRYRQRLGDMAARTAVIDSRIVVPLIPPPAGRGDEQAPGPGAPSDQ